MEVLKERYTITELKERLNVTDHTLRYYEKEFNISIPKDGRGRRFYTPGHANLMYKIRNMRDEGFEIKAIKRILISEHGLKEPPPVVTGNGELGLITTENDSSLQLKQYFDDFRDQITSNISGEICATREQLSLEMKRTKAEIGSYLENSVIKLETKMDRHFENVDRALSSWREKSRETNLRKILSQWFR